MEWVKGFHDLLRDNHPPGSSCWGADGPPIYKYKISVTTQPFII